MNDIDEIVAAARDWAGQPMALATVIEASGSAPRPRGGHLLVAGDGRFAGSISGGCVEYEVFAIAEGVIAGAPASVHHYGSSDPGVWLPGLPCGGQIGVLVQPVSEDGFPPALFGAIEAARKAARPLALSTDLATGRTVAGDLPGHFVNVYEPARRLLIVGGVQIAQTLSAIARATGFSVTVNDPRERFLSAARFPDATLTDAWPDEAVHAFAPDASAAVVTLSHDVKIDDPALAAALLHPTGYVGALGSQANQARRLERLEALGIDRAALARIDGPAGVPIGGMGPQEIALSIAAGIVKALRAGQ
ncbi:XdhC family protein [Sphingobium lignivorans]|uniref:Xanthine dehydrogenase accessory factor n=1 Tax=Sphingobium lignivorans TaxID=2735886 RepID=A0ABR6NHM5_9SPHN|nr:XdhC family protein [Sphingobium lignivorans]MBB5985689.1 xanthine dehydrogenase accessory factor [Sphingobium lignivorans]